jgi:hypothetical protein
MSLSKHRNGPREFAQWAIPFVEEVLHFDNADDNDWSDTKGHLWSVGDPSQPLGENSEILCKFPKPSNDPDPWHGYPVSPANGAGEKPPPPLLKRWQKDNIIGRPMVKSILRQQI